MSVSTLFPVRVQRKTSLADDIIGLTLVTTDGTELPAFEAGAHIDLELPNGLIRQYSLASSPASRSHYELGILLDPQSRGGSASAHNDIQEGALVNISQPRNLFPLVPASGYRLFAGGIGITPMMAMAEALFLQGQPFELHYAARSRRRAAYVERLHSAPWANRVHLYFDDEADASPLNAQRQLALPAGDHLYVCGPEGFIRFITDTAAAQGWPPHQVHFEKFSAPATPHANIDEQSFELQLASSGEIITVGPDESAADALVRAGVGIALSCEQGICGSCLIPVIDGIPEHRDYFQSEAEKAANQRFTPCCSRARSRRLVLDL